VRLTHAIVRTPATTFASGITTSQLGKPLLAKALEQHEAYCDALRQAGLDVVALTSDARYPDSTFVEDAAVVSGSRAIIARPGASSRLGETAAVRSAVATFFDAIDEIEAPGTLDGGDVCEADDRAFIGLSQRTNRNGAGQLASWFSAQGKPAAIVDIRDLPILHLKSGMAYLGNRVFAVIGQLATRLEVPESALVAVTPSEAYGANCVRVNGVVLIAEGHPLLQRELLQRGFEPCVLDVSEFRKIDGGVSYLSMRF
jgi:dimethylargininase